MSASHTGRHTTMDVFSFLKDFGEKDEWEMADMNMSGHVNTIESVNVEGPPSSTSALPANPLLEGEEDITDAKIREYRSALASSARAEKSSKSVRFMVSNDLKDSFEANAPSRGVSGNTEIFYWNRPCSETDRFPAPHKETFLSTSPFTEQEQEAHPGVFDNPQFDQIWKEEPLRIETSDVTICPEPCFRGAAFRVCFRPGKFASNEAIIARGTPIIFGGVSWTTTTYVVTWKRWTDSSTALVQVNAFLRDQRTYNPYSPTWPAFILEVPTDRCFATFPPSVPRPPYIPSTLVDSLNHVTAELEAMKKMSVFQFLYSKLSTAI